MLLKMQAQMVQMKMKIESKTETKMAMTMNKFKRDRAASHESLSHEKVSCYHFVSENLGNL